MKLLKMLILFGCLNMLYGVWLIYLGHTTWGQVEIICSMFGIAITLAMLTNRIRHD